MSLSKEILEGTVEGVKRLLARGTEVNLIDEYGFTPLIQAVATNKLEIVQLLLQHNAIVDVMDVTGHTALHWAADNDHYEITKLLLAFGGDPNVYSSDGQSVLFYPLLRKNKALTKLLTQHGANLEFAKDFIQAKLIGHRFELRGNTDIITPEGLFLSIDLEGFYLEYTLDIIHDSLGKFLHSYEAHRRNIYKKELNIILHSFQNAFYLRKFKHFSKEVKEHLESIRALMQIDLLLLPVSYKGHAITFIKHGTFWAKCDRGVHKMTDPIVIHHIHNALTLNENFYLSLLYDKHSEKFIKSDLNKLLALTPYASLPIEHQVTGNCSWANVQASVPTMLFMLLYDQYQKEAPSKAKEKNHISKLVKNTLAFYFAWVEWDKDRAIEDWLSGFDSLSLQRQKSKAALLAAVLFQALYPDRPKDVKRAKKILSILSRKDFQYTVRIYLNVFVHGNRSQKGQAFFKLLQVCGYQLSDFQH